MTAASSSPIPETLRRSLAQLASTLVESDDLDATVQELVRYSVDALGVRHGGVTLIELDGTLTTMGQTDDSVVTVDTLQLELDEGPCLDAARATQSQVVLATQLESDARWPRWGPAAAAEGLPAVLSVEMHARGRRLGALNLYGESAMAFDHDDLELARVLADQAAHAIAALRTEENLERALTTRTIIGQAQGILMERYGIDADRAFAVLKRHSQDTNVKLRDVAAGIVEDTASSR